MTEFSTPPRKKITNEAELNTPIKIPASPFLQKIGWGTGVGVYMFERSSKVGPDLSPWAIKKWLKEKSNKTNDRRLRLEADVLRQLNHPNIIGFRAFIKGEDGKPCLAMEVLDTSLGDKIEQRQNSEKAGEPFPAKDILKVGFEIAKGLEYLHHTVYILHGDIKSWNILVSDDFNTIKLCDFGHSLPLTESLEMDTSKGDFSYIGTDCWNPPEVISENGPVTSAADIWTYGLVLWEMIALMPPHCEDFDESFDNSTTFEDMRNNQLESDVDINESMTDMDESMTDLKEIMPSRYSKYGTRPAIPSTFDFSKDYSNILEIFFICTTNYKQRPSAKVLVKYYKNCTNINKK